MALACHTTIRAMREIVDFAVDWLAAART